MSDDEDITLEILGKKYNYKETSKLAFVMYMTEGFHFDQSYVDWCHLTGEGWSRKDFGFLLLYFLDKVADEESKALCKDNTENIKKEMNQ